MSGTIVLLSGGLDSVAALHWALASRERTSVRAIGFMYGQPNCDAELTAAGRFHALGNANPETLEPYPFASFDSTSWQRDAAYSNSAGWPFNRCTKETRMRSYIEATETIAHRPAKQMRLFGGAA